mmetsp:Transcript_1719/g.2635  ORF Transcript_1719/g.2635 Transcript_1719/m.2635 type:complete len:208 (-) Transcript_1719:904-1527(-)
MPTPASPSDALLKQDLARSNPEVPLQPLEQATSRMLSEPCANACPLRLDTLFLPFPLPSQLIELGFELLLVLFLNASAHSTTFLLKKLADFWHLLPELSSAQALQTEEIIANTRHLQYPRSVELAVVLHWPSHMQRPDRSKLLRTEVVEQRDTLAEEHPLPYHWHIRIPRMRLLWKQQEGGFFPMKFPVEDQRKMEFSQIKSILAAW